MNAPVDPGDAAQVAEVLHATRELMGSDGLLDLLARLPGTRVRTGRPRSRWRAGTPTEVWLGEDFRLVVGEPLLLHHVVSGVTLAQDRLLPAETGTRLAERVVALTRDQGSQSEASVVLTAARDVAGRLRP